MQTLKSIIGSLFVATLICSCGSGSTDTETTENLSSGTVGSSLLDGDPAEIALSMQLVSSSSLSSKFSNTKQNSDGTFTPGNAPVVIETAAANLRRIDLKRRGASCEAIGFQPQPNVTCQTETEQEDGGTQVEAEIRVHGPFLVDLLTGEISPSLDGIEVPSGVYELELRFDDDGTLGSDSFVVTGLFIDSSDVEHGFELRLRINEEIEVENVAVDVLEDRVNTFLVSIDVEKIFLGTDLAACVDSGDLTINSQDILVIDEDSGSDECENIEETIEENIENLSISLNGKTSSDDDESDDDDDSDDDDSSDD